MGKYAALISASLAIASLAGADRTIDETRPAKLDGTVVVENTSGLVELVGWERPEIHLEGRLEQNVERVDFDVRNGRAGIKVVIPKRPNRDKSAYLTIHVPKNSVLEVRAVSADVTSEGVRAAMDVETVSGDVRLAMPQAEGGQTRAPRAEEEAGGLLPIPEAKRPGRVRVKTVSGNIQMTADADSMTIKTVSGDVRYSGDAEELQAEAVSGELNLSGPIGRLTASAVSGDITAGDVERAVEANTSSGDVTVKGENIENAKIDTVSGDVAVVCALASAGRMNFSTSSGDVNVRFIKEAAAEFSLETSSGDFDVDMGAVTLNGTRSKREFRFTKGSGTGSVRIETTSGDISLRTE